MPSADKDIGLLLRQAMDKVAFLPFGLLVDKWRWGVFDGSITPANYNNAWVELKHRLSGHRPAGRAPGRGVRLRAPSIHIPGNTPYTRYFLARVLQFQFYKAACDQAGWKGPLHRCSFYGNKEVGAKLNAMLAMGASKPWPDALEAFTGTREMSGKAMVEYFAPLKAWLDQQNAGKTQRLVGTKKGSAATALPLLVADASRLVSDRAGLDLGRRQFVDRALGGAGFLERQRFLGDLLLGAGVAAARRSAVALEIIGAALAQILDRVAGAGEALLDRLGGAGEAALDLGGQFAAGFLERLVAAREQEGTRAPAAAAATTVTAPVAIAALV